ncbi:hypothetical protein ACFE04_019156 [Oxalis oulophora]
MVLNDVWTVGAGENSKEVDIQTNRNRREKETIYRTAQEMPLNPRDPWDLEMDYDDSLTPEIPAEQAPDAEAMEAQITQIDPEPVNNAVGSSLQISSGGNGAEPDLELLAVLLKNPDLVFALTSGQAGNLPSEQTVKLLDMIKSGGLGLVGNLNEANGRVKENMETSLPSPTPSSPATSGWKPETVRNPFTQLGQTETTFTLPSATVERFPTTSRFVQPQAQSPNIVMQQVERRQQNTTTLRHSYLPNSPQSIGSSQLIPNSHAFISDATIHAPLRSYRPPMANVSPSQESFGVREGSVSNRLRASQTDYNALYRGPASHITSPGHSWEANEYGSNNGGGFQSWSPDDSPTRSNIQMQGRDTRWDYRQEMSRQQNPSGYRENTFGQGSRKWQERRH